MADELRDLYQEVILEHSKSPRNCRDNPDANHRAIGHNPLCGDRVKIFIKTVDGRIEDVSFEGTGCAISTASVSMLTQVLKGKCVADAKALFTTFREMVTRPPASGKDGIDTAKLGKLAVFSGVNEFPVRVKCATLCWHTMAAALDENHEEVTTE